MPVKCRLCEKVIENIIENGICVYRAPSSAQFDSRHVHYIKDGYNKVCGKCYLLNNERVEPE